MKTAIVKFLNDRYQKTYNYRTDIENLSVGDLAVVESSTGWGIVEIVEIKEGLHSNAIAWVVQRVDVETHKARKEREKLRRAIIAELEEIDAKIAEETKFDRLRGISPRATELLLKLKELS